MDTPEQSPTTAAPVDRLMSRLVDYETVADPSATTAGAPAGDEPSQTAPAANPTEGANQSGEADTSAAATETAPAATPQHLTPEDAAAIADARFQQLLEQQNLRPAQPQDPGAPVDLNDYLDPMGENFGTNLASVLGGILQRVEQSLDQRFQPINDQAAQVQAAEHDEILKTAINDTANTLGGLRGGDAAVQRVMADVRTRYMPEAARIYGNTDRAAQIAIDKAIRAERDYQNQIAGGANVDNAEHLATIAGARTDLAAPGAGSGLVTLPDQPLSARERIAKYAPQIQAARNT
jgi:hypothetical protein